MYESFLFGLMMYGILRGGKDAFSETTLVNALVRDGAVAFIAIFREFPELYSIVASRTLSRGL